MDWPWSPESLAVLQPCHLQWNKNYHLSTIVASKGSNSPDLPFITLISIIEVYLQHRNKGENTFFAVCFFQSNLIHLKLCEVCLKWCVLFQIVANLITVPSSQTKKYTLINLTEWTNIVMFGHFVDHKCYVILFSILVTWVMLAVVCQFSHLGNIYLAGFFSKLNCYWALSFFYSHLLLSLSTYKFESGWWGMPRLQGTNRFKT